MAIPEESDEQLVWEGKEDHQYPKLLFYVCENNACHQPVYSVEDAFRSNQKMSQTQLEYYWKKKA